MWVVRNFCVVCRSFLWLTRRNSHHSRSSLNQFLYLTNQFTCVVTIFSPRTGWWNSDYIKSIKVAIDCYYLRLWVWNHFCGGQPLLVNSACLIIYWDNSYYHIYSAMDRSPLQLLNHGLKHWTIPRLFWSMFYFLFLVLVKDPLKTSL